MIDFKMKKETEILMTVTIQKRIIQNGIFCCKVLNYRIHISILHADFFLCFAPLCKADKIPFK